MECKLLPVVYADSADGNADRSPRAERPVRPLLPLDPDAPALPRTRLFLQEAGVPGLPFLLRRLLRKEDITGPMPLAGFLLVVV